MLYGISMGDCAVPVWHNGSGHVSGPKVYFEFTLEFLINTDLQVSLDAGKLAKIINLDPQISIDSGDIPAYHFSWSYKFPQEQFGPD